MRRRFTEMLRAAEAARARRARGEYDPIDTWWERTRARVLAKVADAVAEQRLLWHLRHLDAAHLYHPSDMTGERALAIMRASMVRDRDRHFRWLVIDTLLMLVLGVGLFFVPGPNVIGYYFAFRVVGHYLSWKGAQAGARRRDLDDLAVRPAERAAGRAAPGAAAARRRASTPWPSGCGCRGWRCSSTASAGRASVAEPRPAGGA